MSSRLAFAVGLICLSSPLQAQNFPQQRFQSGRQQVPMQIQVQQMEIQGVIEGVRQGLIVVRDEKDLPWQIAIPMNAKVKVTGMANAEWLQAGMFIEFTAEIDEHGMLKKKVGELTIVTLSQEKQPGLVPMESAETKKNEKDDSPQGTGEKHVKKAAKPSKRAGGKATVAGTYRIVGRLMVGRNGKTSVQVDRFTLPLELTEQPSIAIDINNYTVASKGDKATVKGLMGIGQPGKAQATEVAIELAQPLTTGLKKSPAAKSETKRTSKRAEKEQGLPEPPTDK